jgi:hypothetical protein
VPSRSVPAIRIIYWYSRALDEVDIIETIYFLLGYQKVNGFLFKPLACTKFGQAHFLSAFARLEEACQRLVHYL